jgi:hypothetical protein
LQSNSDPCTPARTQSDGEAAVNRAMGHVATKIIKDDIDKEKDPNHVSSILMQ